MKKCFVIAILLACLIFIIKFSKGQRRITNGTFAFEGQDTSFVVYIVNQDEPWYAGWMCAGSLIHPALILTSAACMMDTGKLYAIAGYRKYVSAIDIDFDNCTRHLKRRVQSYCTYKDHNLTKDNAEWVENDIAIARVEFQFDLFDRRYLLFCSYMPTIIGVNYYYEYVEPGTDVTVYGWGHSEYYRQENDASDYNMNSLKYARSVIIDRNECADKYKNVYSKLATIIKDKAICTDGRGNIDGNGYFVSVLPPTLFGCTRRKDESQYSLEPCPLNEILDKNSSEALKKDPSDGSSNSSETLSKDILMAVLLDKNSRGILNNAKTRRIFFDTRRNGICQNDHGAPLVGWAGGRPYVVAVASAYLVKQNMKCTGPYVFMSVFASASFIECVLDKNRSRSIFEIDKPSEITRRNGTDFESDEKRNISRSSPCDHQPDNVKIITRNITWPQH